jgi:hypothetical protein
MLIIICAGGCNAPRHKLAGEQAKKSLEEYVLKQASAILRARQADDTAGIIIPIAAALPFAWDRVFILSPYSNPDIYIKNCDIDLAVLKETGIASSDRIEVVAFTNKKQLVSFFTVPLYDNPSKIRLLRVNNLPDCGMAKQDAKAMLLVTTVNGNH